jgi:HlyD family secretion protein
VSKRKSKRWLLLLAAVLGLLAVFGWTDARRLLVPATVAKIDGKAVQRGPLRISVVERGNLKAADSATLRCELERTTTIIYLIDEGTHVQPGDLLCELDSAELVQRRVEQEISVQNREAAYIKAKQSYEIQKSENDSAIATAERALEFAHMDLRKYLDGEYPQELQQRDEDIVLAEEELKRAAQNLEWSEKLAEKGFLEQTQLDADRLAEKRAEIQVAQRRRAKELLTDYEYPRQLRELEANVDEARRELDRERLQADARIVDFAANERTSKAQLDLEREELRKIDSQLAKARIYAPVAGMVVYAVEEGGGRFSNSEPIQEGSTVREREAIITIPTANDMIAEASLHESVLEKVKTGMPCVITVDAVPGRTYRGDRPSARTSPSRSPTRRSRLTGCRRTCPTRWPSPRVRSARPRPSRGRSRPPCTGHNRPSPSASRRSCP